LEINETKHGDAMVVVPDGSLGSAPECTKLEQRLSILLEKRTQSIIVDLVQVRRISGAALRTLLVVKRRLASGGGALVLCRLNEKVLKVFEIAGFDRDFTIVPSLDEALKAAKSKSVAAAAEPGTQPAEEAPAAPPPSDDLTRWADRLALALAGASGPTLKPFQGRKEGPAPALLALGERMRKALGCS